MFVVLHRASSVDGVIDNNNGIYCIWSRRISMLTSDVYRVLMALVTRRKGLCVSYAFSGQHETHKNITGAIFQCLKLSRSVIHVYLTILQLNPNLIMTNYISLERSKTPKYILHQFCC